LTPACRVQAPNGIRSGMSITVGDHTGR
jgi:hypothetical protein